MPGNVQVVNPTLTLSKSLLIHEAIGEVIFESGFSTVTHSDIAKIIRSRTNNYPVEYEKYASIISKARQYLEVKRQCTIWNIRGKGYRIANADELALFTAKSVRRSILMADRTTRLLNIVDRQRMPGAIRKVFLTNESRIRHLGKYGRNFISTFLEYMHEQKRLEVKGGKNGKNGKQKDRVGSDSETKVS